jgi:hypothetical protein
MTSRPAASELLDSPRNAPWSWLPISDGALRRDLVTSFAVKRIDGPFKEGHTSLWTIEVTTAVHDEPVALRLQFFDHRELCDWVDQVFPGAVFSLLPPRIVEESESFQLQDAPQGESVRGLDAKSLAQVLRDIGNGMAGGAAYEPLHGNPPPGGPHAS